MGVEMFGLNNFRYRKYQDRKQLLAEDIRKEIGRRKGQSTRILMDLIYHGERYTWQLEQHAFNYTMRISELRKRGYIIECEYVSPGNYLYKYYGFKPNSKAAKERATA